MLSGSCPTKNSFHFLSGRAVPLCHPEDCGHNSWSTGCHHNHPAAILSLYWFYWSRGGSHGMCHPVIQKCQAGKMNCGLEGAAWIMADLTRHHVPLWEVWPETWELSSVLTPWYDPGLTLTISVLHQESCSHCIVKSAVWVSNNVFKPYRYSWFVK